MSTPAIAPSPGVPSTDPRTATEGSHSFRAALPLSVIFFFLVGFFFIYLIRDLVQYFASAWPTRPGGAGAGGFPDPRRGDGSRGLDPSVLEAFFPIRRYSSLKGLREGECETECAVCLSEFSGNDPLRLLPACRHAFHRGCIDLWLSSHSTCPVCRSDLRKSPEKKAGGRSEEGQGSTRGGGVALPTRRDEAEEP